VFLLKVVSTTTAQLAKATPALCKIKTLLANKCNYGRQALQAGCLGLLCRLEIELPLTRVKSVCVCVCLFVCWVSFLNLIWSVGD